MRRRRGSGGARAARPSGTVSSGRAARLGARCRGGSRPARRGWPRPRPGSRRSGPRAARRRCARRSRGSGRDGRRVSGEMELAAPPGVIAADDALDAAHPAGGEAHREGPPVELGLRRRDRDPEPAAALVRPDARGGEDGGVAHDPAVAPPLVPGVENEAPGLAEGPGAARVSSSSSRSRAARPSGADDRLSRRELAHRRLGLAGRDVFDVRLGHGAPRRADRAAAALERSRVDRRAAMTGGPRGRRRRSRPQAVSMRSGSAPPAAAPALGGALAEAGAETPLALGPHDRLEGQLEGPSEDRGDAVRRVLDPMPQERLDRRIPPPVRSPFPTVVLQPHGAPQWTAPAGADPGRGTRRHRRRHRRPNFQTSGCSAHASYGVSQGNDGVDRFSVPHGSLLRSRNAAEAEARSSVPAFGGRDRGGSAAAPRSRACR